MKKIAGIQFDDDELDMVKQAARIPEPSGFAEGLRHHLRNFWNAPEVQNFASNTVANAGTMGNKLWDRYFPGIKRDSGNFLKDYGRQYVDWSNEFNRMQQGLYETNNAVMRDRFLPQLQNAVPPPPTNAPSGMRTMPYFPSNGYLYDRPDLMQRDLEALLGNWQPQGAN